MATEQARACGFRKVGKMYLVGDWHPTTCDRLPYWLSICPTCGHGIHQGRGMQEIEPLPLFGLHENCTCVGKCLMCIPPNGKHYIMWVGKRYYKTAKDFVAEAETMGISKAISAIPRGFTIGKSVVYLAHRLTERAQPMENGFPGFTELKEKPGIFLVWRPERIEKIYWDNQKDSEFVEADIKRGITPVFVTKGDVDHLRQD